MRERKHCSELIVSAPAIDGGGDGGVRGEKTKTFSIHIPSIVCGLILDFFYCSFMSALSSFNKKFTPFTFTSRL